MNRRSFFGGLVGLVSFPFGLGERERGNPTEEVKELIAEVDNLCQKLDMLSNRNRKRLRAKVRRMGL